MRTVLNYILRKAGIVRRTVLVTVKPETLPAAFIPAPAALQPAPLTGDAIRDTGEEAEPAMAGIPEDAVQMPTPAAPSPGLPPVDPISTTEAEHVKESPATPSPAKPKRRSTTRQGTPVRVRGGNLLKVAPDNRP